MPSVVIEGFKSYREQVATEPFSAKVNCVAIRFVLSDLFQNLRSEDRHALLHEGAGHQVLSAFVEIVFDNSDNRIPVDKEEVRLRRTIGLKKDEYFLDGKHITKTEVMNLLESAGFSRSNPYYIVQQGKIASLTLMKDSERLDLLKEIGGTRVYEERRRNKIKQINQVVQYLDERLKELDEEKEELRKYQQLDKQRKSLEYTIYDKELHDARQKLVEVEEARAKVSETSTRMYDSVLDAHERSKDLEKTYRDLTKEIQVLKREKETTEKRRTEAIKKRTQLELDYKDLQEKISSTIRAKEDAVKQLEALQMEIQKTRDDLNNIRPSYDEKVKEEEDIAKGIMDREKQLSILYQKQGRATQFSSKAARDRWLQKEIDDLERVLSSNMAQERKLEDEIQQLKADLEEQDVYIEGKQKDAGALESLISNSHEDFSYFKAKRDELQDQRRSLWTKENELSSEIDKLKAEVVKAEKSLDHATPGDIRRGLNSVRRICSDYGIGGVFARTVICRDLDVATKEITKLVSEQQKIDAKQTHDKSELEQLKQDIANAKKQKQAIAKALEKKEKLRSNVRIQIDQLRASLTMKQAEMGTELIDHLSPEEKDLLSRLNPEITELKEKLIACRAERLETEARIGDLETNLSTNLVRRQQELEAIKFSEETDLLHNEAELKKEELMDAISMVDDTTQQLKRVSENIDESSKKLKKIKDEKDKLKALEDEYERTLQDEAKELENLLSKRNILLAKQEEYSKKIRELGPLLSDAFETYKRKSTKELHKILHKCNEQLQQFSHVNKKALDQYVNFTEQREELKNRQKELEAGDEKIRELIEVLDRRKDESIERTFKGVARHFREVFSELVQGGHGYLVMMKKKDGDRGDDDLDEDGPREADPEGRVEKYIGVKVKVSFTGQGETQSMKQLSGGQKTVVALTLIFAIQRSLWRRILNHLADMIRRLADMANTQFITTTFRPELVKVADKIYGVTHKNRIRS
ncbi:RecF/RecN/SMC, N-terminal [Dillenia turbinata]|uniref:RecF/RecN/SMC, N-terminal n=1 Tax=Dillenia turbinata TaxID=194707 RepID=A0AAN8UC04_9MAGN